MKRELIPIASATLPPGHDITTAQLLLGAPRSGRENALLVVGGTGSLLEIHSFNFNKAFEKKPSFRGQRGDVSCVCALSAIDAGDGVYDLECEDDSVAIFAGGTGGLVTRHTLASERPHTVRGFGTRHVRALALVRCGGGTRQLLAAGVTNAIALLECDTLQHLWNIQLADARYPFVLFFAGARLAFLSPENGGTIGFFRVDAPNSQLSVKSYEAATINVPLPGHVEAYQVVHRRDLVAMSLSPSTGRLVAVSPVWNEDERLTVHDVACRCRTPHEEDDDDETVVDAPLFEATDHPSSVAIMSDDLHLVAVSLNYVRATGRTEVSVSLDSMVLNRRMDTRTFTSAKYHTSPPDLPVLTVCNDLIVVAYENEIHAFVAA